MSGWAEGSCPKCGAKVVVPFGPGSAWTAAYPTAAGYYWWRAQPGDRPVMREVRDYGGLSAYHEGDDAWYALGEYGYFKGEWKGPLDPEAGHAG